MGSKRKLLRRHGRAIFTVFAILFVLRKSKLRIGLRNDHPLIHTSSQSVQNLGPQSEMKYSSRNSLRLGVVHAENLAPDLKGGDLRIYGVIQILRNLGHEVTYIFMETGAQKYSIGMDLLRSTGIKIWGPCPRDLMSSALHFKVKEYDMVLMWLWPNEKYLTFLLHLHAVLKATSPHTLLLSVSDDLIDERVVMETGNKWAFHYLETQLLEEADVLLGINSDIVSKLERKFLWKKKVEMLPYIHTNIFHIPRRYSHQRNGVAFLGFDNLANTIALEWICDNLMHSLEVNKITLNVYGAVQGRNIRPCSKSPFYIHHGIVGEQRLLEGLASARVLVAPVFAPAGISTKIIKALSCGTPVLTTDMGAYGLRVTPSIPLISNRESFSQILLDVYRNETLWQKYAKNSRDYVLRYYSEASKRKEVQVMIANISSNYFDKRNSWQSEKIKIYLDYPHDGSSFSTLQNLARELEKFPNVAVTDNRVDHFERYDCYLRFQWPHNFTRPELCRKQTCKFILYIPWEFGSVPKSWDREYEKIDAIWTPSSFSAQMFPKNIRGIIKIVPHGVKCDNFLHQKRKKSILFEKKLPSTTSFLYVGADLPRKGVDILLKSWCSAFYVHDNVELILKLSYSHTKTSLHTIFESEVAMKREYGVDPKKCAKITLLSKYVSDISKLYESAHVYINPSRAEGFGLTPLEALANDLVVISSDKGATVQYLSSSSAELVHSRRERCKIWPCQGQSLCVFPTDSGSFTKCEILHEYPSWYSMDRNSLVKTLQNTEVHLKSLGSKAIAGRDYVCEHFSWANIANMARYELNPPSTMIDRELWSKQFKNLKSTHFLVPAITDIIDLESFEYLNDYFSNSSM